MRALLVTLALASAGAGCSALPPAKQAQLDTLECRARALAPVVEPAFDAVELARDLYLGRASLTAVLKALDAGEAEIRGLLDALQACDPPAPAAIDAG